MPLVLYWNKATKYQLVLLFSKSKQRIWERTGQFSRNFFMSQIRLFVCRRWGLGSDIRDACRAAGRKKGLALILAAPAGLWGASRPWL